MAPATDPPFSIRANSVSKAPTPHVGVIVAVVFGALAVIGIATALLVWFLRRRTAPDAHRTTVAERYTTDLYIDKRFLADATSAAPLLRENSPWGIQDDMKDGRSSLGMYTPNGKIQESNIHTPLSLRLEEKPLQVFRPANPRGAAPDMSGATTDLFVEPASITLQAPAPAIDPPSHRPDLHKLAIPPPPAASTVDAIRPGRLETKEEDIASLLSADSESLYSQPSAEDGPDNSVSGTPTRERLRVEDPQSPRRVNTFLISRILKQRAAHSPQPISRSVSRIERRGSIQSFRGEERDVPTPSRSLKKKKRQKRSVPLASMAPLPERPSSPTPSASSKRTIRQNGISLDPWEPSTPPTVSSRDMPASSILGSSSTVHLIKQFPPPPAAGPSVVRTNAGTDPHSRPSSQPIHIASSRPDSPWTASSPTATSARSADDDEGETSPMLRTMRLSHKAQLVTLPRQASVLPSVYPDAAQHYHDPSQQKRNTVPFKHEWKGTTPPLEIKKPSGGPPRHSGFVNSE